MEDYLFLSTTCSACHEAVRFIKDRPDYLRLLKVYYVDRPIIDEDAKRVWESLSGIVPQIRTQDGRSLYGAMRIVSYLENRVQSSKGFAP